MNIVVLTPIRMLGDGLRACLGSRPEINVLAIVGDSRALRAALAAARADLVLIDVTHGIDLHDVRALAAEHPAVGLVALGLTEQRQDVIRCGQAGFTGYVSREAPVEALHEALSNVMAGRLCCSPEISGGLLRALFEQPAPVPAPAPVRALLLDDIDAPLTRRESEVLNLIGEARSNKEIARELSISVATVKHHVHNLLEKLRLPGRAQAMRCLRNARARAPQSGD